MRTRVKATATILISLLAGCGSGASDSITLSSTDAPAVVTARCSSGTTEVIDVAGVFQTCMDSTKNRGDGQPKSYLAAKAACSSAALFLCVDSDLMTGIKVSGINDSTTKYIWPGGYQQRVGQVDTYPTERLCSKDANTWTEGGTPRFTTGSNGGCFGGLDASLAQDEAGVPMIHDYYCCDR